MTNEEQLDEARAKEAERLWESFRDGGVSSPSIVAARLARENWTPPEPVDPDVLAFREWWRTEGGCNDGLLPTRAYLAGARMAREQEQERAKGLLEYVEADAREGCNGARITLAKYQGEA